MRFCLIDWLERDLEKKVPAAGLGLFRVFFGLVILQEIIYLSYFRHLIFDPVPFLDEANPIVSGALAAWFLVAVFLTIGLFTFACSVANYCFWVLFVLLTPMWRDFDGGFDQLMTSSSLLLILVRTERRFSLDNLRTQLKSPNLAPKRTQDTQTPVIDYYLFTGVSLGLLYFDAALHKLHSEIWLNGLGAWVPNTMPYYISPLDLDWFLNSRGLQELTGYSLFVFQLSFLFIFTRRLFRIPLLFFGCLFHLGILVCLNIYPYGFGMLVHYILFVPFHWWVFIAHKIRHPYPVLQTYCNTSDRCSLRIALILRHFDVRNFSDYRFVSKSDEIPDILHTLYPDFESFTLASLDRQKQAHCGLDGFSRSNYFRLLSLLLRCFDFVTSGFFKGARAISGVSTHFSRFSTRLVEILAKLVSNPRAGNTHASSRTIRRYLAIVLILQLNSTIYYGILKNFDLNEPSTQAGKILREISMGLTSLSHVFFGITPHALYMDNHFNGYEEITAFTYLDFAGLEHWLPFIAADGRFMSPTWGRVHSMWANIAMHPPFNRIVFERLAVKVTAFWAEKLGIGTRDSTFIIQTKAIQISFRWIEGLRKKNLGGNWSEFGTIRWKEGRFSIEYRSGKPPNSNPIIESAQE